MIEQLGPRPADVGLDLLESDPDPQPDPQPDPRPARGLEHDRDPEPGRATGDDHEPGGEAGDARAAAPTGRHRLRRVLIGLLLCVLVLGGIPAAILGYLGYHLNHQVQRIPDVFTGLPDRPARAAGVAAQAQNILLLGTDRRSDVPTTGSTAQAPSWEPGEQRSDAIMILHVSADRQEVSVVSIPRDSWVDVPGHGPAKINAAFSYGGPRLAVETVEQLTHIHIDHLAVIDWDGLIALTDDVGGVDVDIPATVHDTAWNVTWTAGRHHLDGQQALAYVRQRYGLPGGDFDRERRQQAVLRAIMLASLDAHLASSPKQLYGFLDTTTQHLSIDSDWSLKAMGSLALSLRNLDSANLKFLVAPVAGTGMEGAQSVVRLAPRADAGLWDAIAADRMDEWTSTHWKLLTGSVVN